MFTEARAQWLYQHYRWLEEHLAPREAAHPRMCVLPTSTFFPARNTGDHAFAEAMFARTKELMDMVDWPCRLVARAEQDDAEAAALQRGGVFGEMARHGAAGTFQVGDDVEITYAPGLLRDPADLVATFAHELSHYLLAEVEAEPPAGWDELEPLTDLTAVVEGFGVFLANAAFAFQQWSDGQHHGWRYATRGYLNAAELAFALGIFCVRHHVPPELPARFLKPNPRQVFADSLDYIAELER